jgi:hypothetical protein
MGTIKSVHLKMKHLPEQPTETVIFRQTIPLPQKAGLLFVNGRVAHPALLQVFSFQQSQYFRSSGVGDLSSDIGLQCSINKSTVAVPKGLSKIRFESLRGLKWICQCLGHATGK